VCRELILISIVTGGGTVSDARMRLMRCFCHHHKGVERKKKLCDAISRIMG
jgi:hypothetical protein